MTDSAKHPRRRLAVAVVGVLLIGLLQAPAEAYHRDRYRELQDKIETARERLRRAQERERDLIDLVERSDRKRAALEARLDIVTDKLSLAQARLAEIEESLDRVSGELLLKNRELEHALGALEAQTDQVNRRASTIYKLGPIDHTVIVFSARDLHSIVAGEQYAKSVLRADSVLLDQVRDSKERIESVRNTIALKKLEIEEAAARQEAETRRIAGIRAEQAAVRRQVVQTMNYRQNLLDQVRDQKDAYRRAIRSYERESVDILDYLRRYQGGGTYRGGRAGYLHWPVRGRITSYFGWRVHPIHKYRSFHTGIDISSPRGTRVKAARRGEVLYTGYKGAYGLIVLVDHGKSIATMYAHLSKVYVRPGENVSTGESVAAVGCTGWCTGPHLHFEVRVHGEPSNPLAWL